MRPPRPYRDRRDFHAMCDLLSAGRLAGSDGTTETFYVHPGDLAWWLYYPPLETDLFRYLHLWDDPGGNHGLVAWALISPDEGAWDVFLRPDLCATPAGEALNRWVECRAREVNATGNHKRLYRYWIAEDDPWLAPFLTQLGYAPAEHNLLLERALDAPLPEPVLPPGFVARAMRGAADVPARARASYDAFDNAAKPWDAYLRRYEDFRRSPVYAADRDRVIVAPDGRIAAFGIVWTDEVTRIGHFEPVGVHPAFQRMGLGKALMADGLRTLRSLGMRAATVCPAESNAVALRLYHAVGFTARRRLVVYALPVSGATGITPAGA